MSRRTIVRCGEFGPHRPSEGHLAPCPLRGAILLAVAISPISLEALICFASGCWNLDAPLANLVGGLLRVSPFERSPKSSAVVLADILRSS